MTFRDKLCLVHLHAAAGIQVGLVEEKIGFVVREPTTYRIPPNGAIGQSIENK
jgi:hypothetical protein